MIFICMIFKDDINNTKYEKILFIMISKYLVLFFLINFIFEYSHFIEKMWIFYVEVVYMHRYLNFFLKMKYNMYIYVI
jgi:hypothetical protein